MAPPSDACLRRLRKEYKKLEADPVPNMEAVPLESNILEWHYCINGPADTPYENGIYHGKIKFPPEYPYKPPSIYMITPNGRFQVNQRLCLSMSDFHPEEWSCLWSVSSILAGLLSFMTDSAPTFGSIVTSDATKRQLAAASLEFNVKNLLFVKLFPNHKQLYEERLVAVAINAAPSTSTLNLREPISGNTRVWSPVDLADRFIIAGMILLIGIGISYMY